MLDSERAKSQTKQLNKTLQEAIPVYKIINDSALKLYHASMAYLQGTIILLDQKIENTTGISYKKSKNLLNVVEKKVDDILTKVENALQIQKSYEDKIVVKNPKDRIITIIVRFNRVIVLQTETAIKYSGIVVEEGRKLAISYCLPLYITLKATVIISQEIILEVLQSSIQKMNTSYQASKGIVSMLVKGKFTERNIPKIIQENIKHFGQMAMIVVQKGLETKMDAQSLIQICQALVIRLLVIIDNMRQKGALQVTSAKQKSSNMYKEVITRIKEKEIHIKMSYYERSTPLKLK